MNLVLHQFRKDARYLRPYWLPWLAVLLLTLATDAEWLAPMRAGEENPVWYALLPLLMWGGAVWLALAYPPEDACADDHSFIAVKPLPRPSYWAARGLVLAGMIGLPLVLQEGFYMAVSQCSAGDIALGMFERAFLAGALLMCLWPLPALARGWQRYALVGVAVFTYLLTSYGFGQVLTRAFRVYAGMFITSQKMQQAAYVGAVAVLLLALWQKQRAPGFAKLAAGIAGCVLLTFALAASPLLQDWSQSPRDAVWVAGVESKYRHSLTPQSIVASASENEKGGEEVEVRAQIKVPDVPANILPHWRLQSSTLRSGQGESASNGRLLYEGRAFLQMTGYFASTNPEIADALQPATAPRTLMMSRDTGGDIETVDLGQFSRPADLNLPAALSSEHEVDWLRYGILDSASLNVGAQLRSARAQVEILRISPHANAAGKPEPGSLTLTIKLGHRALAIGGSPMFWWQSTPLVLYAPGQRLVWTDGEGGGITATRATHAGWMRGVYQVYWKGVIKPGTGITAKNLGDLRVILANVEYLGMSRHQVDVPHLDLAAAQDGGGMSSFEAPLVATNPRQALETMVKRLPAPPLDAPRADAARYFAKVGVLAHSLRSREQLNDDGTPKWPGNDRAVAALVAPYVVRHPDLITQLNDVAAFGGINFLRQVMDAALLASGAPGLKLHKESSVEMLMHEPSRTFVGVGVTRKDWEQSKPLFAETLRQKSIDPMLPLMEQWQAASARKLSADELLQTLRVAPSPLHWKWVREKHREIADAAREAIHQIYDRQVLPVPRMRGKSSSVAGAAVFAGVPEALDLMLRQVALMNEAEDLEAWNHLVLSSLSEALSGPKLEWQDLPGFIRQVRGWRAEDFVYDQAALIWKRRVKP